jgi:hypothetical protein
MVVKKRETPRNDATTQAQELVRSSESAVHNIAARWETCDNIASLQEREQALVDTRVVKALYDEAERKRRDIVDPLNTSVKKINALFKPFTSKCEEYEHHLKALVVAFDDTAKRAAIAEVEKRAKKVEKASPQLAADIREQAALHAVPQSEGVSSVTVWRARVTNESLIPREFLCVDEKKLSAYAKAMGKSAVVAGVEFYEDTILRVGGAK